MLEIALENFTIKRNKKGSILILRNLTKILASLGRTVADGYMRDRFRLSEAKGFIEQLLFHTFCQPDLLQMIFTN